MRTVLFGEVETSLPVGFLLPSDEKDAPPVVLRTFEVGPVTGRVRIAMSAEGVRDNQGRRTTEMIAGTLKSLGHLSSVTRDLVRQLSFPDREYFGWVHLRRRIRDATMSFTDTCPDCRTSIEVTTDFSKMLVNVLDPGDYEVRPVKLPGLDVPRPIQTFVFTSSEHGVARLRLLTGEDEERHAVFHAKNPEEGQLRDGYACLVAFNDQVLSFEDYLNLAQETLGWLADCARSLDLGSSQRTRVTCPECGKEQVFALDPLAFLEHLAPKPVQPPYVTKSSTSP